MDVSLFSADARKDRGDRRLRRRELRRILAMLRPYLGTLVLGLVATVAFATLHTVSIGAALPVFKVLLEEEGLHGWIDRTVAGNRLNVEFAPPGGSAPDWVRVLRVTGRSALFPDGNRTYVAIADAAGRPPAALLHDLAHAAPTGNEPPFFAIKAAFTDDVRPEDVESAQISLPTLDAQARLLRWAGSLVPAATDSRKLETLEFLLIGLVITVIAANVFRYLGEVLIARSVLRAMMGLRAKLYARTLCLPMSFFASQTTADLVTRFVQDVQEIQRGMLTLLGKFIREPMRALFIMYLAFTLDWRITLTMVVAAPIAVAVFLLVGRSVKKANRKLLQAYGMMIGALTASLQNLRVVKAYTAEPQEQERLGKVDWRMFKQQLKLAKLQAFVSPMMETLAIIGGSVVTIWLASRVLDHELPVSKFAALGVTLSMLFDPLRKLSDVYVRVQRSTAGAERIFQVIDHPVEGDETDRTVELKPLQKGIEYVGVSFTYFGAVEPAVRNVSLSIRRGETVAIVGPNGSGKTTLVSLLPRFFDPDSGVILYDGVDVRDARLSSLRGQIGLVSQDAVIFAGTPVENIAYGVPAPDEKSAVHAAVRASADEFIRAIPGGYGAALGERGTTLSGGQRQRMAIARAIFRDAPILIFDEATSQIDSESEQKIQTALREFSRGRTTLIIAHRLSTIQFADRIVVMDAGSVIDTGTHRELFESCKLYRKLCETQFVPEPAAAV